MTTMDIIKFYGGSPANFLDVGGYVFTEQVTEAFKILVRRQERARVSGRTFGGIMKCDVIANDIYTAVKQVNVRVPLVCVSKAPMLELGKKILKESGPAIISAYSMADAAQTTRNLTSHNTPPYVLLRGAPSRHPRSPPWKAA